jgi:hypothetical protein
MSNLFLSYLYKTICMACHYIRFANHLEFKKALEERDPDLVMKLVKCVISASKRNKDKINVFDVYFNNTDMLTYTVEKHSYGEVLEKCLNDMILIEEYELCAEIVKILNKKTRKIKNKL